MLIQAVSRRRCASCDRWEGQRQLGEEAETVVIESESTEGLCLGGPWDGSERRAGMACGRWVRWSALPDGQ